MLRCKLAILWHLEDENAGSFVALLDAAGRVAGESLATATGGRRSSHSPAIFRWLIGLIG